MLNKCLLQLTDMKIIQCNMFKLCITSTTANRAWTTKLQHIKVELTIPLHCVFVPQCFNTCLPMSCPSRA